MSRNDNFLTRNLLDYCIIKTIGIDLWRQTNTSIPQQIDFIGKLEEYDGATMFFSAEEQQRNVLNLSVVSLIITKNINNGTSKNIELIKWSKRF